MSKKHQIDLTNGPILKTLAELALPIMASAFLGTAYNITDMAWIGILGSQSCSRSRYGRNVCLAVTGTLYLLHVWAARLM